MGNRTLRRHCSVRLLWSTNNVDSTDSWVFRVVPAPGESFGHYLGRFRRANGLSHRAIAEHLGVREVWVEDWERPSRRRNPTALQLVALSKLVEVEVLQLRKMLPPVRLHLQTRLCAACYAQTSVHQAGWQREGKGVCGRHALSLLSACPICRRGFRTPALWEDECCEGCGLALGEMQSHQRSSQQRFPQGSLRASLATSADGDELDGCQ
jgi:transcriptional regulator with XRE-family HTH domain